MKTNQKKSRNRKKKQTPRIDIYEKVTAQILTQLEQGTVPWRSPHVAQIGFPRNFQSNRDYQGVNVLLLAMARFVSPYFLTYLQAQALGGQVRKGERGSLVVKYGEYEKKVGEGKAAEETEKRGYLKGYTVFNSCQIDGIDFPEIKKPDYTPSQRATRAQKIIDGFPNPPDIREGRGTRTCYDRERDVIDIPNRSYFESEEKFFGSLYHEAVHATGSKGRLARPSLLNSAGIDGTGEDKKNYGKEELIAEIGASFLMSHAGIAQDEYEQNAAYLKCWLDALKVKEHKRWIVEAAAQAQKAVTYILNQDPKKSP